MLTPIRFAVLLALVAAPVALAADFKLTGDPHIANAGGEVVNDTELVWKVTIPEAWIWRPAKSVVGNTVLVTYTAGQSDEAVAAAGPAKAGDIVCFTAHALERNTADLGQAEVNALTVAAATSAADAIAKLPEGPGKTISFAESREAAGIAVAAVLQPAADGLTGTATLRLPGVVFTLHCQAKADAAMDAPSLAVLPALLKSYTPL